MSDANASLITLLAEAHKLVDLTLRYVAAGGSAILAFGLIQQRNFDFLRASAPSHEISPWLLILFVAVLGIAIYTIHRALLYRLVTLFLYGAISKWKDKSWTPFALEKKLRQQQDTRRATRDQRLRTLETWAAECHFLYCSAWGTLSAAGVAVWLDIQPDTGTKICSALGAILLVAAIFHDTQHVLADLSNLPTEPERRGSKLDASSGTAGGPEAPPPKLRESK